MAGHGLILRASALAVAWAAGLTPRPGRAGPEAHLVADDAQVVVGADGVASVRHRMRWRVARGPLRSIDLTSVDSRAVLDPTVPVATDDGRELIAHPSRLPDGTVRIAVAVDDPRAITRGDFIFDVRWRLDLVAARALTLDGPLWRLNLSAPSAPDGLDGARTTFDLPAAPQEPRPIVPETGAIDESPVATVRRGVDRDILDLVRPHVARGESVAWTLRVDPRALPLVTDPRLRTPPSAAGLPGERAHVRGAIVAALLLTLAFAFGKLVALKTRAFSAACAARGGRARGLLPMPDRVRPAVAAVALCAALVFECAADPPSAKTAAGLCAAVSMLAAALRAPAAVARVRGPGRWVLWHPDHAFRRHPDDGHWLDIGARTGRLTATAAAAIVALGYLLVSRIDSEAAWMLAIDAMVFLPLLLTGCTAQLPPEGARSSSRWLGRVFARLASVATLGVAPWARVGPDGTTADELRLFVMPRATVPGFVALEVGLAWSSTPVCWVATPELLVRVREGSAAAAKLAHALPNIAAVPGRRPEERVRRLLPRRPTASSTVSLVHAVADLLRERRLAPADADRGPRERRGRIESRAAGAAERAA
jgi:hypothetical protein